MLAGTGEDGSPTGEGTGENARFVSKQPNGPHLTVNDWLASVVAQLSTAPPAQLSLQDQEVAPTHGHLDSPKYKRAVQMSFRMVTPRNSNSGSITVRKGIPKDVRADYQRLYGAGWEAKFTVPAGTPKHEAKVRISEWTAEVETRIASLRTARNGEGQSLTKRNAHALAGEWYQWYVARHEENPGTPEHWRTMWDVLISELEDHAAEEVHEKPWRDPRPKGSRRDTSGHCGRGEDRAIPRQQGRGADERGTGPISRLRAGRVHGGNFAARAAGGRRLRVRRETVAVPEVRRTPCQAGHHRDAMGAV
jgi:hypothetical protein